MIATQVSPYVILGPAAERPPPASVPQGCVYFAKDTGASFVLVVDDATGVRSWRPTLVISVGFYKFSGGRTPIDGPSLTAYMADESPVDQSGNVRGTGSPSPLAYGVRAPSSAQAYVVSVTDNSMLRPVTVGFYRNGTLVASVSVAPGTTGVTTGATAVPFAAGDTLDVGTTLAEDEGLSGTFALSVIYDLLV